MRQYNRGGRRPSMPPIPSARAIERLENMEFCGAVCKRKGRGGSWMKNATPMRIRRLSHAAHMPRSRCKNDTFDQSKYRQTDFVGLCSVLPKKIAVFACGKTVPAKTPLNCFSKRFLTAIIKQTAPFLSTQNRYSTRHKMGCLA